MKENVSILGFAGSLRKDSYNRALLRAATELVPENAQLAIFELEGIPMFDQDLESQLPQRVKEFKAEIRAADALLIVTPEYNYSIPGVLKNAIDWASRPFDDNVWKGKPVALMSASTGRFGGARAQYHLRQCFVYLDMYPLNRPEVMVSHAKDYFDEQGRLKDNETRQHVKELLNELVNWTRKLKTQ